MNAASVRLPSFLVASFPKSGTTSLHEYLAANPRLCLAENKETYFWTEHYDKGINWYESCFVPGEAHVARGEVATEMLHDEEPMRRYQGHFPEAKIVVLLRDPIERCLSHYFHCLRRGYVEGTIRDALEFEERRAREGELTPGIAMRGTGASYLPAVKLILELYPREQVKFAFFEEITERSEALGAIEEFIGVTPGDAPLGHDNPRRLPRSGRLRDALEGIERGVEKARSGAGKACPRAVREVLGPLAYRFTRLVRAAGDLNQKPVSRERLADIDPQLHAELAGYYAERLEGLDALMGIDVKRHWPWFGAADVK